MCETALKNLLPLFRSDDTTRKDEATWTLFEAYYDRMRRFAQKWLKDEDLAEDAVQDALWNFVRYPPEDDRDLEAYLRKCVRRAANRLWTRRNTFGTSLKIVEITTGDETRIRLDQEHGFQNPQKVKISKSNCEPCIDGAYQASEVQIVDASTISLPKAVTAAGTDGRLHVRRRRPVGEFPSRPGGDANQWDPPDDGNTEPSMPVEQEDDRTALREAIQNLPDKFRKVILLYYDEERDFTCAAIADILEISEKTVRTRRQKAIGMLRRTLADSK